MDRLRDVLAACEAIQRHVDGRDVDDPLVFDAVRMRLVELGEAVKDIHPTTLVTEPGIPWAAIARMRDQLTHRYFDSSHAVVIATVRHDIAPLAAAVRRLLGEDT